MQRWPSLLDPSVPLQVDEFDDCVASLEDFRLYSEADRTLSAFHEMEGSFFRVHAILENSRRPDAQHIALGVLNDAIVSRWHTLERGQQNTIRNFLGSFVMSVGTNAVAVQHHRHLVVKAASTLVSVAKHEWPDRWPTFVSEVIGSATNVPAAQNALLILKLLLEEVFECAHRTMTSRWASRKKQALAGELASIFSLCFSVTNPAEGNAPAPIDLVARALETLATLIPCLEPSVTTDTRFSALSHTLATAVCEPHLRMNAIRCLHEYSLVCSAANEVLVAQSFVLALRNCAFLLDDCDSSFSGGGGCGSVNGNDNNNEQQQQQPSAGINNNEGNNDDGGGGGNNSNNALSNSVETKVMQAMAINDNFEMFFQLVGVYATHVICKHLPVILGLDDGEGSTCLQWASRMFIGLAYSQVKECLKIAVDFWWNVGELLVRKRSAAARDFILNELEDVRLALIRNMAKPEEVTIFEDEDGELQHQVLSDVESVQLYVSMRETLVYFTHVDPDGIQSNVMELIDRQLKRTEWNWASLNSLCWSFGAISGALPYDEEKSFFVHFVKNLLKLCEGMRGQANRAVIASGVMYVLGQYPQFLEKHARFLRTVIGKIHEFFKEPFPGIKEMSVDTLLKVNRNCARALWSTIDPTSSPPVPQAVSLVNAAEETIVDLFYNDRYTFYEAMGYVAAAAPTRQDASQCVSVLLRSCNGVLRNVTDAASRDSNAMITGFDDLRSMLHACRIIGRVAKTCGPCFLPEMSEEVFPAMSHLMPLFAQRIAFVVSNQGPPALQHQGTRVLRQLKREFLKITEHFVASTDDTQYLAETIFPHVFGFILTDYNEGYPATREAAVLALVEAAVRRARHQLNSSVHNILGSAFAPTVSLIAENPEDFPEHRVNFFKMLEALCLHCFDPFLAEVRDNEQMMQGVFWAVRHVEPHTSTIACDLLISLLNGIGDHELGGPFCEHYLGKIFEEVFASLLDRLHQQVFRVQCAVLQRLFALAATLHLDGVLSTLQKNLSKLEGMSSGQTQRFVSDCVGKCRPVDVRSHGVPDEFCDVVADFLIEVKIWNAQTEDTFQRDKEYEARVSEVQGLKRPTTAADMTYLQKQSGKGGGGEGGGGYNNNRDNLDDLGADFSGDGSDIGAGSGS